MNAYWAGASAGCFIISLFLTWAASRILLKVFTKWRRRYARIITSNILSLLICLEGVLLASQPDVQGDDIVAGLFVFTMPLAQLIWLVADLRRSRGAPAAPQKAGPSQPAHSSSQQYFKMEP